MYLHPRQQQFWHLYCQFPRDRWHHDLEHLQWVLEFRQVPQQTHHWQYCLRLFLYSILNELKNFMISIGRFSVTYGSRDWELPLERVGISDLTSKAKYIWLVMNLVWIGELKCLMIPGQLQQRHQSVVKMGAKTRPIQMQYPAFNWIKSISKFEKPHLSTNQKCILILI